MDRPSPKIANMKTARMTALLLTALILPGGILLLAPTAYRALRHLRKPASGAVL